MTNVAQTFEALVSVARHCPESNQLDVHAVNLVSYLASFPGGQACVALVCAKTFSRYQGFERVTYILEDYGVQLLRRWHPNHNAFFLFARLTDKTPDPFMGAKVIELEPVTLKVAA